MQIKTFQKTFSYRLRPSKWQKKLLNQFAGCTRFVFNQGLSKFKDAFDNKKKLPTYVDIANLLPKLKKAEETKWLKDVHSQILQQSLKDLFLAVQHFFRRLKNKEMPGFPKFKKRGSKDSFRYPQSIKVKDGKVYLPKIGWTKYIDSRNIEGIIQQATIKREGNHWYIHISCEVQKEVIIAPIIEQKAIGIDVGIKDFAYLSNDQKIENPKHLKKSLTKLARLQKSLSRKKKGSNNSAKFRKKVTKLHIKTKNKRKDFHHKLSTELVKNHDIIAVENLTVAGMIKNRKLSQAISDVGWSQFLDMLEYKADWNGKHFVKVDKFLPSSKTCSSCKAKQDMPLNIRVFNCKICGLSLNRDLNASLNIKAAGLSAIACENFSTF